MSFRANHTGNVNKDPDNDVQFYLGICVVLSGLLLHVSYMRHFLAYFAFEHVTAFKLLCFPHRFSERALSHFMDWSISSDSATRSSTHK